MELNSQRARFFFFVILLQTDIFFSYTTLFFNPLSESLFAFLIGVWSEIQPLDIVAAIRTSSFVFHKRLATTLNTAALLSRTKSVHIIARQEIEGITHFQKTYISSLKGAELNEEEIVDSFTLLSWYIHRFWKNLVRHIFPTTKLIAKTYPQFMQQLPETIHWIYDPNWFQQNFIIITEVPLENIQKLSINQNNIEIKNYNAENLLFTFTHNTENVNMFLEASSIENLDTIIHSQAADT